MKTLYESILSSINAGKAKIDKEFNKALKLCGLNLKKTKIYKDNSVDYEGNVNICRLNLKKIPIKFNHVS